MDIHTIGVVGAGTMGSGLAQMAASSGLVVRLLDSDTEAMDRALHAIAHRVARDVRRGRLAEGDSEAIVKRVRPCRGWDELASADFVVEAVTERLDVKQAVFQELDRICRPEVVLSSCTSGLSITDIAAATSRPDLVIGTHFFNPVPIMKLVEIVRGARTSDDAEEIAVALCSRLGKECIFVKDAPLFVVNRILVPMLNEAIFVLQEGLAAPSDIDKGMMLGAHHPMGPLALADMLGLDTLLLVAETLFKETGDPKYRPAPLLRQMVRAQKFGKKSGEGFYRYDES